MLLPALVAFVVLGFILQQLLGYLNQRSASQPIDPAIAHLYDEAERQKSITYSAAQYKVGLLSSGVMTAVLVAALVFGWLADLDAWVRERVSIEILVSLTFVAAVVLVRWLIALPFSLYTTFAVEARYGFNKTSWQTYIADTIKNGLLTTILGGALLTAVLWLYEQLGNQFWIAAWLVIAGFMFVMAMFGTTVLLPLFNKLAPVPEGELRDRIVEYCKSQGYAVGKLCIMDGSKRSTKANAFFAGLGKTKMIVLFDTLVQKLNTDEVVAVLAHEVGHYKRKHALSLLLLVTAETFAMLAIFGWLLGYSGLSAALGASQPSFHLSAFTFFLFYAPLAMLQGLLNNSISRKREFEADQFAKRTDSVTALATALEKTATDSLNNLNPHPWYVRFNYTHPPLKERLAGLK